MKIPHPMPAIKVENLSKSYLVGHNAAKAERYTALRDVIARNARDLARKTRDMIHGRPIIQGDEVEEFWALKDIDFEIQQGDRVGIIGRNGAGKSTLLKILSRITEPTTGRITINGRVASLLEVGTGFHPELTGRENIFLNGAILGMSRKEIQKKFDEIVDFAEVEKFLDTPVKRYSSGMYVRLAFAVAAHLEPEILIVDEVLAVGDTQFQKKCLGKMEEVGRNGRTVLFVSHNMDAVQRLCSEAIVLSSGYKGFEGESASAIEHYMRLATKDTNGYADLQNHAGRSKDMIPIAISVGIRNGESTKDYARCITSGRDVFFDIHANSNLNSIDLMQIGISNMQGQRILTVSSHHCATEDSVKLVGDGVITCHIPSLPLAPGDYSATVMLGRRVPPHNLDYIENALTFSVEMGDYFGTGTGPLPGQGFIVQRSNWEVK